MQPFRLTPLHRAVIVCAAVLATAAVVYIESVNPLLALAPIAVVSVLIITAVTSSPWGYVAAIVFAAAFALERGRPYHLQPEAAAFSFVLMAATNVIAVLLVALIRKTTGQMVSARSRGELEASDARYRAIGESMPYGVWETKGDELCFMSDSYLQLIGSTLDEIKNGAWLDRVPAEDATRFLEQWKARDEKGDDTFECEYRIRGQDGKYRSILSRGVRVYRNGHPTDVWVGLSLDITERKRAEEALRFLADAGRILSGSLEPGEVLDRIVGLVVPRLADDCAVHLIENGDVTVAVARQSASAGADLDAKRDDDRVHAEAVIRSGASEIRSDRAESLIIVPIVARNRVFGALTLRSAPSGGRFDAVDLELAEHLGRRCGLAYDNALLYAREHRVAETLQRAALPAQLPEAPGLSIAAAYVSGAAGLEVGGDWYDALRLPDGKIALSIGDVAGKGLRAAAAMSAIRQAQRTSAIEHYSPGGVLARTNRVLLIERGDMVTSVFGVFDPVTRTFTYASAGHPAPIIAQRDGSASLLTGGGVPLGLFRGATFPERMIEIPDGSLLVLYTDGLLEHDRDILRGEADVLAAASDEAKNPSADPAAGIVRRVLTKPPGDDIAVLVVSVLESAGRLDVTMQAAPSNLRELREAARRFALSAGLDRDRVGLLLIAVGEALNNAVEHAYGAGEGVVELRGWKNDDRLIIEVSDQGAWRPPRNGRSGHGLSIMRALVEGVTVQQSGRGTSVRFELPSTGVQGRERAGKLSHR